MRYLPIHTFSSLTTDVDLFSEDGLSQFREKLTQDEAKKNARQSGFTDEDIIGLIHQLNSSQTVLFHNWIAQNKDLEKLLMDASQTVDDFVDTSGILSHQYFNQFKRFVSPYLANQLLQGAIKTEEERARLLSYCKLLDNDHIGVVEEHLFKPIREKLSELSSLLKGSETEQDLINVVQPICGDVYIKMANSLSKSSYALKLLYVDTILSALKSKACTARLANWVLKQMEQLTLNNEHQLKITEIRKELREGKFEVKNKGMGKTPLRLRSVMPVILLLLIGFMTFYIIYFKPFSQVEEPVIEQSSSFTEFSKEERQKLDSLIQTMSTPLMNDGEGYEETIPIVSNTTLNVRKPFNNSLLEAIYSDLKKDATIQSNQVVDSCELLRKKFQRYNGVKDLMKRDASVECAIKNESDYDALLYVAESKKNGKVYSVYIKQNSTRIFKINKGDYMFAVAGNIYVPFVPPNSYTVAALPSSDFKYHFCDTDVNYEASINKAFEYTDNTRKRTKFMIMGRVGSYFEIMDIYSVLSQY